MTHGFFVFTVWPLVLFFFFQFALVLAFSPPRLALGGHRTFSISRRTGGRSRARIHWIHFTRAAGGTAWTGEGPLQTKQIKKKKKLSRSKQNNPFSPPEHPPKFPVGCVIRTAAVESASLMKLRQRVLPKACRCANYEPSRHARIRARTARLRSRASNAPTRPSVGEGASSGRHATAATAGHFQAWTTSLFLSRSTGFVFS